MKCPKCGNSEDHEIFTISNTIHYTCKKCGNRWKVDM